jgi:hypothetical protein
LENKYGWLENKYLPTGVRIFIKTYFIYSYQNKKFIIIYKLIIIFIG